MNWGRKVAPFAGAWIEIVAARHEPGGIFVAPFAGAWIEMAKLYLYRPAPRGVAPFAGAWIEISL